MIHADTARNRLTGIGLISLTVLCFSLLDGSAQPRLPDLISLLRRRGLDRQCH